MKKIFNVILLILVFIALYYILQNQKSKLKNDNFVNLDKIYYENIEPTHKIEFNYDQERPIDKQFLKEQNVGSQLSTWYPNTWIEKIDENGEPIFNSREKVTGVKETFIDSKARFTYEFNSPRSVQMDGVIDPNDFKNGKGRTIKEIYDNSFVDYKKKVPKKVLTEINSEQFKTHNAASNLSFINPDIWVYDEEKPENGGIFENGLMASDPFISNSLGNSHATVN
jgi:hypothetical protein